MTAKTLIEALSLWEATGSQIAQTARETSELLARNGIPNLLAGGLAVQLHGYPRFTEDVDLIVPDVEAAHQLLMTRGFSQSLVKLLAVIHPHFDVTVDLLPAGKCLDQRCKVPFPAPDSNLVMHPVTLEQLISLKLDSWLIYPVRRDQDKVDVRKLIENNGLPRDLVIDPAMQATYQALWDELSAETAADPEMPES